MPEEGPRDFSLSESLVSKLLDIECTLEEDWTDVEDPDKLGESTPWRVYIWDWRWCQQLAKKVYGKPEGGINDLPQVMLCFQWEPVEIEVKVF